MPVNLVGRTDQGTFTGATFLGFGGRAIAYSPALGAAAVATGLGTMFRYNVLNFNGATQVAFAIYNATTRALLENVIVTPAGGTGFQEVAMAGTTQFTTGEFYKVVMYNNSPGEQVQLASDPAGLPAGFVDGTVASPADPIPAEPFSETFPNREYYWEVLGDDPPPAGDGAGLIRNLI